MFCINLNRSSFFIFLSPFAFRKSLASPLERFSASFLPAAPSNSLLSCCISFSSITPSLFVSSASKMLFSCSVCNCSRFTPPLNPVRLTFTAFLPLPNDKSCVDILAYLSYILIINVFFGVNFTGNLNFLHYLM